MSEPNMPQGEGSEESIGQKVAHKAREQYESVRETAGQYYEQGKEKAMEWEQGIEDYVREQPMKSLLIAAGVGVLLGIIWRRS